MTGPKRWRINFNMFQILVILSLCFVHMYIMINFRNCTISLSKNIPSEQRGRVALLITRKKYKTIKSWSSLAIIFVKYETAIKTQKYKTKYFFMHPFFTFAYISWGNPLPTTYINVASLSPIVKIEKGKFGFKM